MAYAQYASGRNQLYLDPTTITITSGGNLIPGTYYFAISCANRAGLNLPSNLVSVTVPVNSQITITLPELYLGEDWQEIVLSASTVNDSTELVQVCSVNAKDTFGVIRLSNVEDLDLRRAVNTENDLPINPLRGSIRYVNDYTRYYVHNPDSLKPLDSISYTVLDALIGRWEIIGTWNTYISDTTGPGGCDRELGLLEPVNVKVPSYACDGSKGASVIYWLRNGGFETIPQGTHIAVTVFYNGQDYSQLFDKLLVFDPLGHVNTITGNIDSTLAEGEITFQAKLNTLSLKEDLNPGEAYAIAISLQFRPEFLDKKVIQFTYISLSISFTASTGEYIGGSKAIGDIIYAESDRMRIVPDVGLSVKKLAGTAFIQGYEVPVIKPEVVTGLQANTANQYILLTGNGTAFVSSTLIEGTALRAIVGTEDGVGLDSGFLETVSLDNTKLLKVNVTYPSTIRANYPDVIAGNINGEFNASRIRIYVKPVGGSIITYFESTVILGESEQEFIVGDIDGTTIDTLPDIDNSFGLYKTNNFTTLSNDGNSIFSTGSYQIAIAFVYENTITFISHSTTRSCIYEAGSDLATVFDSTKYWSQAVEDLNSLRNLNSAKVFPCQNRMVLNTDYGQQQYTFNSSTVGIDDNDQCIRPTSISENHSGRWEPTTKRVLKSLILELVDIPPITGANQVALFADVFDGKIKVRAPNNGVITLLGTSSISTTSNFDSMTKTQWDNLSKNDWDNLEK